MITKTKAKLLIIGCGDIGIRLAGLLPVAEYQVSGLRRNTLSLPEIIIPIACDLNDSQSINAALSNHYDHIVITLTPNQRDEAGYKQMYASNVKAIINALNINQQQPSRLLFVSSTSVYGQNQGEWVDEASPTKPSRYNGQYLLQAEQQLLQSPYATTIVRFSGVYGPGRDRLLNNVKSGQWNRADQHYTNRIHADDCARVLKFLLQQPEDKTIHSCYLASDSEPVKANTVKEWIAEKLSLPLPQQQEQQEIDDENKRVSDQGKRCNNQRLIQQGFEFTYPSFREGYAALIAANHGAAGGK